MPAEARSEPATPPAKRDRRAQSRHAVDTSASIFVINVAVRFEGRILDLSLSGCRIRTRERFTLGIFRRVEAEFRLEGLPFRLGGVTQSIHDRNTVGIRFLDMSERKLDQLTQLIEEIEELRQQERSATEFGAAGPMGAAAPQSAARENTDLEDNENGRLRQGDS